MMASAAISTIACQAHVIRGSTRGINRHHTTCGVSLLHQNLVHYPTQPEISNLYLCGCAVDENVRRLYVPVNHITRVDELEPLENLVCDVANVVYGEMLI